MKPEQLQTLQNAIDKNAETLEKSTEDLIRAKLASLPIDLFASTRAAAKDWAGTLTALTGLGTILAVLGRENINELAVWLQGIVAVLLIITLGITARAIWLAALASQGKKESWPTTPKAYWKKLERETTIAADQIERSRALVRQILFFTALTTLVIWFGPQLFPLPVKARVIFENGSVVCGEVTSSTSGEITHVAQTLLGTQKIGGYEEVTSCPKVSASEETTAPDQPETPPAN